MQLDSQGVINETKVDKKRLIMVLDIFIDACVNEIIDFFTFIFSSVTVIHLMTK